jgi:hypothetical protein
VGNFDDVDVARGTPQYKRYFEIKIAAFQDEKYIPETLKVLTHLNILT